MKKLLLIAALATLSAPAFASKARLNALGNADHLVDAQTAFDNPAHLTLLGDYVTFEGGPTNAVTTVVPGTTKWSELSNATGPNAEGGFVQSHGDAKWGAYLGRKSAFTDKMRKAFGFLQQENPIELQYATKGPINWGAAINYSSSDQKSAGKKQTAMGLRLGATTDMWEAFAVIGLGSTAKGTGAANLLTYDQNNDDIINVGEISALLADPNAEYKGTTGFKIGGAYKMDHLRFYGKYYQDGFKYSTDGAVVSTAPFDGTEVSASQLDLGMIDVSKIDGGNWFYGVAYQMYNSKMAMTAGDVKVTNTYLPFLMGMEYDAASWLALRASVTQNVLLGSTKTDDGALTTTVTDETDTVANNTKVAAGFGLKMNKWIVDGSWAAATSATGAINMNSLLTNVGLTYNF